MFLGEVPQNTVAGSSNKSMFNFIRNGHTAFRATVSFFIWTHYVWGTGFSTSLLVFGIAGIFNFHHSDGRAVIARRGLICVTDDAWSS